MSSDITALTADSPDADLVDRLCRLVADVPGDVDEIVQQHVGAVAPLVHGSQRERLIAAAVARLAGLDGLDMLLADPGVDEILVNRGGEVWVERDGELHRAGAIAPSTVPVVLERVLAPLGRRLDRTSPIVDARLPDGSRVCAVIEPVAVDGPAVSIRRFRRQRLPLEAFCSASVADLLRHVVTSRCNVMVAGATSTGKTSLVGALLEVVGPTERIVVLEDTTELQPGSGHVVRLEARAGSVEGVRAVPLDELVRTALRLRPDRLVVGEVRGAEVLALVQAMNTGHDGSLTTCHANGPTDALARLETLVMQAAPTWPLAAIRAQLTRSIDVVVHVTRTSTAARRVAAVAEVVEGDGPPQLRTIADHTGAVGELQRRRIR
jgi:pilus assembly protein CpaF